VHIGKLRVIELKSFADRHRLKISRNECGETIIPGKHGQIYEYNEEMLGVMFTPPKTKAEPWGNWCPRTWGNFRRAAEATGMTVLQNGDSEGCLGFDTGNREQVRLALKIAGVRRKRVSPWSRSLGLPASVSNGRLTHRKGPWASRNAQKALPGG